MINTGQKITFERTKASRLPETDLQNIKFGRVFSDHMFVMDFSDGGWQRPRIIPFGPMIMSPASLVLHYSQTIFEGLKAYRSVDGGINLIRPLDNIARMRRSAERMCMPPVPDDIFLDALRELIRVDK
ncbi:MAG: branched chain amino acid aminotransferase, partial [Flavobacteriales bacterium]